MYLICFDTCLVGVWYLLIYEVENGEVSVVTIGLKKYYRYGMGIYFFISLAEQNIFCRFFCVCYIVGNVLILLSFMDYERRHTPTKHVSFLGRVARLFACFLFSINKFYIILRLV